MTTEGITEAVQHIVAEPDLAKAVYEDPAAALASFDLTQQERDRITEALAADVEAASDEVQGFAPFGWGIPLVNTAAVPTPNDGPITMTRPQEEIIGW